MKFFTIEESALVHINQLMRRKVDQEYVVLSKYGSVTDICQYSGKYANVHIVTVPTDRLDPGLRLA